ncbi:MAG: nitric oxide reductase transcription regulator, partial [Gammaproteobacteria bacterium]|nr:nitric oxide reductase transcription regulator [Gammaproteobacteria bacterium]
NVRELEHVISRAALFAKADNATGITVISSAHLTGLQIDNSSQEKIQNTETSQQVLDKQQTIDLRLETEAYQRNLIRKALEESEGNWTKAAQQLSMDRANLARLAKRLGIVVAKEIRS